MKNFENLMIVPSTSKVDPNLLCASLMGSWREDVTAWEPEIKSEELLTFLSHLHSVGVNALALHKLKNSKRYEDIIQNIDVINENRSRNIILSLQENACMSLSKLLSKANINYAIIKGLAVAQNYSDKAHRPSGDIDILVSPEDFPRVLSILKPFLNPKYTSDSNTNSLNKVFVLDWLYPSSVSKIDIHTDLEKFQLYNTQELLTESTSFNATNSSITTIAPEYHLRVLCLHFLRHGCWRPLWACDIAAFIEKNSKNLNWDIVANKRSCVHNWISLCFSIVEILLGADLQDVPKEFRNVKMPHWVQRVIMEAWSKPFSFYNGAPNLKTTLLKKPWKLPSSILTRWPNDIESTYIIGANFMPERTRMLHLKTGNRYIKTKLSNFNSK